MTSASEMPSWHEFTTRTAGCAAIVRGKTVAMQGEAERANSAIADAVVDGETLDWERVKRFDDL